MSAEQMPCPLCDGFGYYVGSLGDLEWFQCRACGAKFNLPVSQVIEESENENYPANW